MGFGRRGKCVQGLRRGFLAKRKEEGSVYGGGQLSSLREKLRRKKEEAALALYSPEGGEARIGRGIWRLSPKERCVEARDSSKYEWLTKQCRDQ